MLFSSGEPQRPLTGSSASSSRVCPLGSGSVLGSLPTPNRGFLTWVLGRITWRRLRNPGPGLHPNPNSVRLWRRVRHQPVLSVLFCAAGLEIHFSPHAHSSWCPFPPPFNHHSASQRKDMLLTHLKCYCCATSLPAKTFWVAK